MATAWVRVDRVQSRSARVPGLATAPARCAGSAGRADSKGGPNVKLAATEDGSGLVLGGEDGYVQILSRGPKNLVKIVKKDGREQTLTVAERSK